MPVRVCYDATSQRNTAFTSLLGRGGGGGGGRGIPSRVPYGLILSPSPCKKKKSFRTDCGVCSGPKHIEEFDGTPVGDIAHVR